MQTVNLVGAKVIQPDKVEIEKEGTIGGKVIIETVDGQRYIIAAPQFVPLRLLGPIRTVKVGLGVGMGLE